MDRKNFALTVFLGLWMIGLSSHLKAESYEWLIRELAVCPSYTFPHGVSNLQIEANASSLAPTTIQYFYSGEKKTKILSALLPGQSQTFRSLPAGTLKIGDKFSCGRLGCSAKISEATTSENKDVKPTEEANILLEQDYLIFIVKSTGKISW